MCTTNTQVPFAVQLAYNRSSKMTSCNCLDLCEQSPVSFKLCPHILSNISPRSILIHFNKAFENNAQYNVDSYCTIIVLSIFQNVIQSISFQVQNLMMHHICVQACLIQNTEMYITNSSLNGSLKPFFHITQTKTAT